MTSSLVGSEMCIRDSSSSSMIRKPTADKNGELEQPCGTPRPVEKTSAGCLLYTSDAADDM
eukprot:9746648-Prorocentrum_lima.AAC.1